MESALAPAAQARQATAAASRTLRRVRFMSASLATSAYRALAAPADRLWHGGGALLDHRDRPGALRLQAAGGVVVDAVGVEVHDEHVHQRVVLTAQPGD